MRVNNVVGILAMIIAAAFVVLCGVAGCGDNQANADVPARFVNVFEQDSGSNTGANFIIVEDKQTRVEYIYTYSSPYNTRTMTPLIGPYGKPVLGP